MTVQTVTPEVANAGSYYTIIGAGGDLNQWITGYDGMLADAGIGKPTGWFTLTGQAVNDYAQPLRGSDLFKADLTFLLFPLDGLDVGKLAIFKLENGDRWFDDIISNMLPVFVGSGEDDED